MCLNELTKVCVSTYASFLRFKAIKKLPYFIVGWLEVSAQIEFYASCSLVVEISGTRQYEKIGVGCECGSLPKVCNSAQECSVLVGTS